MAFTETFPFIFPEARPWIGSSTVTISGLLVAVPTYRRVTGGSTITSTGIVSKARPRVVGGGAVGISGVLGWLPRIGVGRAVVAPFDRLVRLIQLPTGQAAVGPVGGLGHCKRWFLATGQASIQPAGQLNKTTRVSLSGLVRIAGRVGKMFRTNIGGLLGITGSEIQVFIYGRIVGQSTTTPTTTLHKTVKVKVGNGTVGLTGGSFEGNRQFRLVSISRKAQRLIGSTPAVHYLLSITRKAQRLLDSLVKRPYED